MSSKLIFIFTLIFFYKISFGQDLTLCESKYNQIIKNSQSLVGDFAMLLETYVITDNQEEQQKIEYKIFNMVVNEDISVLNDINKNEIISHKYHLKGYLTQVAARKSEVKEIIYSDFEPGKIKYNKYQKFYYLPIEAKKKVITEDGETDYIQVFITRIEEIDKNIPLIKINDLHLKKLMPDLNDQDLNTSPCQEIYKQLKFDTNQKYNYQQGSTAAFKWNGGSLDDKITVELVRINKKNEIIGLDTIITDYPNAGYYLDWVIPRHQPKGNYLFRMTNESEQTGLWSPEFEIKRRTPLVWQLLPFGAVVGAILLLNSEDEDELDDLPVPVKPFDR